MAAPPLAALRGASVTFGGHPVFEGIDFGIAPGERLCLVGRNGSGKSTLLKALGGRIELDSGERFVQPGAVIATLSQEPDFGDAKTVGDVLLAGLADPDAGSAAGRLARLTERFALSPDKVLGHLSGGEARRLDLARTLAANPDVLLLDEPTNHLDVTTIEALERDLSNFRGGILMISHDRRFLNTVGNATLWLDRGRLRRLDKGFAEFEEWAEGEMAAEEEQAHKLGRKIAAETKWAREGISARRKRNQGRLRALVDLRKSLDARINAQGRVKIETQEAQGGGTLVVEAENVFKSHGDLPVVKDFSIRILKGARIGIVGPNGVGKTSLVRVLIGQDRPDAGKIRVGVGIEIAQFDQKREALDPNATLWNTVVSGDGRAGNDHVFVNGRPKHVASYLRDYLFTDAQVTGPVKALSGGEKSRLLLARLFTQPSHLLVLDEPTNDLDLDTLDLLEDVIANYPGTVILVSHDRDFLDRVATSTISLEGGGKAVIHAGGYSAVLDYRKRQEAEQAPAAPKQATAKPTASGAPAPAAARAKLSYKDERERGLLPQRIAELEKEIAGLEAKLADPQLFARDRDAFAKATAALDKASGALAEAENRWLELEMEAEALAQGKAS